MKIYKFPDNFLWGAATSSYQIEGAWEADNKSMSIWDDFCRKPGAIYNGDRGDIACDHYYRYEEDIEIMKKIGIKAYRFSVSWPRIMPKGYGEPNKKGVEFYKNLITLLNKNNIKPFLTIYHWDLPLELQKEGGWANRKTAEYFVQYSKYLFKEFGDSVSYWATINEPFIVSMVGNYWGIHAPGIQDPKTAFQVSHNLLLAHGYTVNAFKEMKMKSKIGIVLNMPDIHSASNNMEDKMAARIKEGLINRWYTEPVFKGTYPNFICEFLKKKGIFPEIQADDLKYIHTPVDFLGLNYYSRSVIKYSINDSVLEFDWAEVMSEKTDMGWEIYPEGLFNILKWLQNEYNNIPIYITENGAAFNDHLVNNKVNDIKRINFFQRHFIQANKAIQSGVNLKGFFVWSLLDNFEWNWGYSKRFGITYIDYKTQKRIIKESALWLKEIIRKNSLEEQ